MVRELESNVNVAVARAYVGDWVWQTVPHEPAIDRSVC